MGRTGSNGTGRAVNPRVKGVPGLGMPAHRGRIARACWCLSAVYMLSLLHKLLLGGLASEIGRQIVRLASHRGTNT